MNVTLHSLSLKKIQGAPLISGFLTSSLKFHNIDCDRFMTNFIFTNNIRSLTGTNSKFNHFLSTPIKLSQLDAENTVFTKQYQKFTEDFSLTSCVFHDCRNATVGACLYVKNSNIKALLKKCSFFESIANLHGGAIYSDCAKLDLCTCCFSCCTSYSLGQSVYYQRSGSDSDALLRCYCNDTTIIKCSPNIVRACAGGFFISHTYFFFSNNNFSRCVSRQNAATIMGHAAPIDRIQFTTIDNCSSHFIVEYLYSLTPLRYFKCNLLNSESNSKTALFISGAASDYISCYINGNGLPLVGHTPGMHVEIIFVECLYDTIGVPVTEGLQMKNCRNIVLGDKMNPATPRFRGCRLSNDESVIERYKINPVPVAVTFAAIFMAHMLFIHAGVLRAYYSKIVSGNDEQRIRLLRARLNAAESV